MGLRSMAEIELSYKREVIQELFDEYTSMLAKMNPEIYKCLQVQEYDAELEHLEEKYGVPAGRLYIAKDNGEKAGCIGFHRLSDENCEMKRLYVRSEFRGKGIANQLIRKVICEARKQGYKAMLLDTLPSLQSAVKLYEKHGFYEVPPYYNNPIKSTIYMKLDL